MGIRLFVFLLLGFGFINSAYAAPPVCNAGSEGTIVYNKDQKLVQFCNGSAWIGMVAQIGGTGDTLGDLVCATGDVPEWNGAAWDCGTGGDAAIWTDSGSNYLQYTAAIGARITPITGMAPPDYIPGVDTLGALACTNGQIVKYNGTAWICAADNGGVLPTLNSAQIWVGNGSNAATSVAMSGDATISNAGVLSLENNVITSAKIEDGAVTNADLAAGSVAVVNLSATGTASATTYLRGDNTWTSIPSSVWLSDGPEGPAEIHYNGGNVGIGVNNPDVRLEVYGGIISETDEANGTAVNGTSWPTTGTTLGGYFASHSAAGRAIYARNFGTTGNAYGGSFDSDSVSGVGVSGRAGGTGGDFSASSSTGRAVYGRATAASGSTYAGYFYVDSPTGTAVHGWAPGTTGANKGGHFSAGGSSGIGVYSEVGNAGGIPIVARGAASQTANLQEWRNNSNSVIASVNSSGVFTGNGSGLTALNAANLSSGTVATARLGTGTASGTTYLRGDGTWATVPSAADNLGNHTATTNIILGTNWLSGDGGAEGVRIDTSGSVGIGTTTPEAKLHVAGGGSGNILLDNQGSITAKDTGGTIRNVLHGRWLDNVTYLDGGTGGLNLRVNNSSSEGLFINSSSNVGIGTTSPTQRLDVAGTVKATAFAGDGTGLTNLNATSLATGTVGTARLGSGTANSTTYLRGDGTWAAPSGGSGGSTDIQQFDSSGTWTKPVNARLVHVMCWGGGGGGGRKPTYGGGGGGAGGYLSSTFLASDLPDSVAITIGQGGAGAAVSGNGVSGTATTFGTLITAPGGTYGEGGGSNCASSNFDPGPGGVVYPGGTLNIGNQWSNGGSGGTGCGSSPGEAPVPGGIAGQPVGTGSQKGGAGGAAGGLGGGNGGNSSIAQGFNGTVPGGGGGATTSGIGGSGASGRCNVITSF